MSDISPINTSGISRIGREAESSPRLSERLADAPSRRGADRVEFSDQARLLDLLGGDSQRVDIITQIREQIAGGTYETDEKLDVAAENLFNDLGLG